MFLPLIDGVFHATVLSLAWERMISNSRMGWPAWRRAETVSKMIFTEAEAI